VPSRIKNIFTLRLCGRNMSILWLPQGKWVHNVPSGRKCVSAASRRKMCPLCAFQEENVSYIAFQEKNMSTSYLSGWKYVHYVPSRRKMYQQCAFQKKIDSYLLSRSYVSAMNAFCPCASKEENVSA
jgi:hypothetical protein